MIKCKVMYKHKIPARLNSSLLLVVSIIFHYNWVAHTRFGVIIATQQKVSWRHLDATQAHHNKGGRQGDCIPAAQSMDHNVGLQKLRFCFSWTHSRESSSDASDWPIGGIQSGDVTLLDWLGWLGTLAGYHHLTETLKLSRAEGSRYRLEKG